MSSSVASAVALMLTAAVMALALAEAAGRRLRRFVIRELTPRLALIEDALLVLLEGDGHAASAFARRLRHSIEVRDREAG